MLQQHLLFTVCAEGCEAAEEQGDDEVRTSQVPERSEGKTKVRWKWDLPFTVLKPVHNATSSSFELCHVATTPTVYGIETPQQMSMGNALILRCNSTYRLRYAPKGARQQRSKATMRSAHLKCLNEVKVK